MSASPAIRDLIADSIPNLDKRYKRYLKPPPKKAPKLRYRFKATVWFEPEEWKELLEASMEAGISFTAYLKQRCELEGAKERVSSRAVAAIIRTMKYPPKPKVRPRRKHHDELAVRRRRKRAA